MPEKEPFTEAQTTADAAVSPISTGTAEPTSPTVQRTFWQRVRLNALRVAAVFGAFLLLLTLLTGGAATYTSRPQFCRSCHNMEPYYDSWQESSHKDVSCIKCHFPPGAGEKIRGKLMGLVQLLKYVTESAGPRPAAEIADASCLRCHDTRLLSGRVEFHDVPFDHRPHLSGLRHGKQLRCTSCHSQVMQGQHMAVTTSTCFLCHFKDGLFNEGLGACTRCHQIPEETFDLGGGVKFSHELAYERGVDCASCHGDLIRGNGEVPLERCIVCHNREDDLKKFDDHLFLHQKHVTDHKVDCLECHLEILHSLDQHKIEHAAADCKSCHPNQHGEQVRMLLGEGGKSVPAQHNNMSVARIACPSCHQVKEVSPTGTVLWKASTEACTQCHDVSAAERLQAHHEQLKGSLVEIEASLSRVDEAFRAANLNETRAAEIEKKLGELEDDLNFIRVGNSIHNVHYAASIIRALVKQLSEICRELNIEEPQVVLPTKIELPK